LLFYIFGNKPVDIIKNNQSQHSTVLYKSYANINYGLPEHPDKTEIFDVETDDGYPYGISHKDTFLIDVNNDGKKDKIIRGRFSNITAHGYDFYEIYLHDGTKIDFADFRTVEGADCFLQGYEFQLEPFVIIKASRKIGDDWVEPTEAIIEKYQIVGDKLKQISKKSGGTICDVRSLL
jgi:hypothetical protein